MIPLHKKLIIKDDDLEENGRWRQIREMDYEITKKYPKQIIDSPLLVPYDEPRPAPNGAFKDLMRNGPDEGFVRKLAALMPPEQKHKWKATLSDQMDVVMVDVL